MGSTGPSGQGREGENLQQANLCPEPGMRCANASGSGCKHTQACRAVCAMMKAWDVQVLEGQAEIETAFCSAMSVMSQECHAQPLQVQNKSIHEHVMRTKDLNVQKSFEPRA